MLGPLTGGVAVIGTGEVNGIKLLKQLNNEIAGRKVELIVEDDAGDPTAGLTKAQKLIERDRERGLASHTRPRPKRPR